VFFEGINYHFQFASDVKRDGLGLRCYKITNSETNVVLEIFRNDSEQKFTISIFKPELPLEIVGHAIMIVKNDLGPFQA